MTLSVLEDRARPGVSAGRRRGEKVRSVKIGRASPRGALGPRQTVAGRVSVVVVLYDSADEIEECLRAVAAQTHPDIEVILVDNASPDRSVAAALGVMPGAALVRNETNLGFAAGQNRGMAVATGEFVMPLNPDVRPAPTYVAEMVGAAERSPEVGIVAGKLVLPERDPASGHRLLDGAGLGMTRARHQYLRGHGKPDTGQWDAPAAVFGACGAAPLYRRAMLDDIAVDGEIFDEDLVMHKEDVDLCWRARLLGWQASYTPEAVAEHRRSFRPGRRAGVAPEVRALAVRNRYMLILKNDLLVNWLAHAPWIVAYDVGVAAYVLLRERTSLRALAGIAGCWRGLRRRRRSTLERRRVSAAAMRRLFG